MKYHNKPTRVDDIRFASKKEAAYYIVLKGRLKKGEIYGLELQPRYKLYGKNGGYICTYVADFDYQQDGKGMTTVDVKGVRTPVYKLKAKLFADNYGREVQEI